MQLCFVDLGAKTKRNFARFDLLRIAQLHFDVRKTTFEAARAGELDFNDSIS